MNQLHDVRCSTIVSPVISHDHDGEYDAFSVRVIGKRFGACPDEVNWSLSTLRENNSLRNILARLAQRHCVQKILAPVPSFLGNYVHRTLLTRAVTITDACILYRTKEDQSADIVEVNTGEGYVASPANCPFVVVLYTTKYGNVRLFVLHCARDGLIDPYLCGKVRVPRMYPSLIDRLMQDILKDDGAYRNVRVWVYGGVRGNYFPHSLIDGLHIRTNVAMHRYLVEQRFKESFVLTDNIMLLDLSRLIKLQFRNYGVPSENISLEHAYLDPCFAHVDGAKKMPRNLFFLTRSR